MKKPVWSGVISASVKGADHIRRGTCCQDAVSVRDGIWQGEPYLICSVADGHGSPAYPQSDRGAALAVLSAEQTAVQFMLSVSGDETDLRAEFALYFRSHLREEWIRGITQSCRSYRIAADVVRQHGTTLLTVLIYRDHIYMAQLGDGNICLINRQGKAAFLVEPETGPVSSATASLCSSDTDRHWKFACLPVGEIAFLMLSSDGLINSLTRNDEYVRLAETLRDYLSRFPSAEIREVLPYWLADYSNCGSQDDTSLAAVLMDSTQHTTGEENEKNAENKRDHHSEEAGGGRSGGSVPCPQSGAGVCPEALHQPEVD